MSLSPGCASPARLPRLRPKNSRDSKGDIFILQPPPSAIPAHSPQPPLRRSSLFPWSGPLVQVNNRDVGSRCSQASSREEAHQVQQSAAWGRAQHVRGMLRLPADAYPSQIHESNAMKMPLFSNPWLEPILMPIPTGHDPRPAARGHQDHHGRQQRRLLWWCAGPHLGQRWCPRLYVLPSCTVRPC